VLAISVFIYAFVYRFGLAFFLVLICNVLNPWGPKAWDWYYFLTMLWIPFVIGVITTIWFFIGGIVDLRHLFVDLEQRKRDFSDNGRVEKSEDD
jgi:hypothetical protein